MRETRSVSHSHASPPLHPFEAHAVDEEPSSQSFSETVVDSIAAQYGVAKTAMGKLYRNVSASVRQLDFSALAESDLPFPLRRDEDIGQGQGEETWKCLKPDGTYRVIDASELTSTILVDPDLDDQEIITTDSGVRLRDIRLPACTLRKGRTFSGVSTTVPSLAEAELGDEPMGFSLLPPGGSRLLHRRTKRFHTVAAGLASEARAAVDKVRVESREVLPL